uniref:Uncharacterized protein n=1 Tax=Meloidogyne floridensis TaxID=298350 RepID=A0A915NKY3_9BILA
MLLLCKFIFLFFLFFLKLNAQTADMDKIGDLLPGLNFRPNFEQYSGYLPASENDMLHYWFVTSQNKSDKLGIAIGNAYLSDSLNYNTAPIYAYNHGIIDEEFWNLYGHRCCNGCVDKTDQNDLKQNNKKFYPLLHNLILSRMASKNLLLENNLKTERISYGYSSPCIDDTPINTYMQSPEVQLSLHIPQNQKFKWEECNLNVSDSYDLQYG